VDDYLAATISGGVADAQALLDIMGVQARLHRINRGYPIPVKAATSIASTILFSNRFNPLVVQLILAGVDKSGPSLYQLDPLGGSSQERYIATGSGSPVALGYLEAAVKDSVSVAEAIPLSIKAINVAMQRNTATGNDFDVAIVDGSGYRELSEKEKDDQAVSLGLR